jgi:hypothetical protein
MDFLVLQINNECLALWRFNRYRRTYLERQHADIAPYLYPLIYARVLEKPSVLFLFLQENPHLPDPSDLASAPSRPLSFNGTGHTNHSLQLTLTLTREIKIKSFGLALRTDSSSLSE